MILVLALAGLVLPYQRACTNVSFSGSDRHYGAYTLGVPKPVGSDLQAKKPTRKPGKPVGKLDRSVCLGFLGPVRDRFPVIFRTGSDQ
jgi:hypothetical protein